MADFTKARDETILPWTLLDDTGGVPFVTTGIQSVPNELDTFLVATVAHRDGNDAAAAYVTIKVLTRFGANNDDLRTIQEFQSGGGQATTEALNAESASGQDHIEVASTGDWDTGVGETLFLHNVGTLANSELIIIEDWVTDDYYLAKDNLANTHDNGDGDALYDAVSQHPIRIPAAAQEYEITFHNPDDDATYAVNVVEATITALV